MKLDKPSVFVSLDTTEDTTVAITSGGKPVGGKVWVRSLMPDGTTVRQVVEADKSITLKGDPVYTWIWHTSGLTPFGPKVRFDEVSGDKEFVVLANF